MPAPEIIDEAADQVANLLELTTKQATVEAELRATIARLEQDLKTTQAQLETATKRASAPAPAPPVLSEDDIRPVCEQLQELGLMSQAGKQAALADWAKDPKTLLATTAHLASYIAPLSPRQGAPTQPLSKTDTGTPWY